MNKKRINLIISGMIYQGSGDAKGKKPINVPIQNKKRNPLAPSHFIFKRQH